MNADNFAEWLIRQGHKVLRSTSSYWVELGPGVFQAFPYHWIITPPESELIQLINDQRAICLRYSTPLNSPPGMLSYHSVIRDKPYRIEKLSSKSRSKIRRGLKRCRVQRISVDTLAEDGWRLQQDTIERQDRADSMNQHQWLKICAATKGLADFDVWAAYVEEQLAATIMTAIVDDVCYLLYHQSHRKYFIDYVNNALCFELTQKMLSNDKVEQIFYGLHSLDAPASVDEFKFHMGYIAKPVRQRVFFNPKLSFALNPISHQLIKLILQSFRGNSSIAKAEGLVRFYIEGKKPLEQQIWPENLVDQRDAILTGLIK